MLNEKQVNDLILRTKRYEFRDGLGDFMMALIWLLAGTINWFLFDVGMGMGMAAWQMLALIAVPIVLMISARPLMNLLRRRWLWRASGFVQGHPISVPRRNFVLAGAVLIGSVLITYALSLLRLVDDWFVMHLFIVSMGWANGAFLIASGLHLKLNRWVWVGILGTLATAPILITRLTFGQTWLICGLVWGVMLAISGALALRQTVIGQQEAAA